ncbi:PREDICTED: cation channel sperm-associated protein 4 [Gekko japonicus]|uniref:Cation channel sperm-associated protein 4 n=1 Tax=Gekko japonicus TaxID=146911 RepID=A0ABM1JW86_GEKJA|nr:PREDICTED: cation channel sperm-associated protein 4 [Gekko japonicus]
MAAITVLLRSLLLDDPGLPPVFAANGSPRSSPLHSSFLQKVQWSLGSHENASKKKKEPTPDLPPTGGRPNPDAEPVEVNCKDITRIQDNWDVEEFVSHTCMGIFLHHPAYKLLLAGFIITNAVNIALRTEPTFEEKYFGFFSAIDTIVLAFLICEVLLNWYYGFSLYWKDGWNILNFLIVVFLFFGLLIPVLSDRTFFHILRILRLMQVCTLVAGLARMIQVILKSTPDMLNIMVLLFSIMLVFSVFGVTLFGSLIPVHFGNLGTALYTLFICITQDGWINIYDAFEAEQRGMALRIGGALYFSIFITCGAFICANLLVAVVTTNLEQSVAAYNEERQSQSLARSEAAYTGLDDGTDDDALPPLPPMHMKEVMHATAMVHCQDLLSYGNLGNLNDSTCDDLCVVLEAIHENLKEYREIRDELSQIVHEVRSIKFNIEQEQEIVLRNIRGASISDTMLANEVIQGKAGDVLTTLTNLEKSNMIDTEYQRGAIKTAAMRARRQSLLMPGEIADLLWKYLKIGVKSMTAR